MSGRVVWEPGESFKTGSSAKLERENTYIEWLLTPKAERYPSTKNELAELLGVTTQTLRNYAQDPYVQSELAKRSRSLARVERVPTILDALYRQAIDSENPRSVTASKVLLDWIDKAIEFDKDKGAADMTDNDLFEVLVLLKERLGVV